MAHSGPQQVPHQSTSFNGLTTRPTSSGPPLSTNDHQNPQAGAPMLPANNPMVGDPISGRQVSASTANRSITEIPRFLLSCIDEGRFKATALHQPSVEAIKSDLQLWTTLKSQCMPPQSCWSRLFSLKTVINIEFVQFELLPKQFVSICKIPDIPSEARKDDYEFEPCPATLIPPLASNALTHFYHCPETAGNHNICLRRFPKKLRRRLTIAPDTEIGWGLHFVRGLDKPKFCIITTIVLAMSFIFGVVWSIVRNDLGGAMGASAYLVTVFLCGVGSLQVYFA